MSELKPKKGGLSQFFRNMGRSRTDKINERNKNINEYESGPVDVFYSSESGIFNSIISGGSADIRNRALVSQAVNSYNAGFPNVILHNGNRNLEDNLAYTFQGIPNNLTLVNSMNPAFEPFYKLTNQEIIDQVIETAPEKLDINYKTGAYLDAVCDIIHLRKKVPSFKALHSCPYHKLFDMVQNFEMQNAITPAQSQSLQAKLMNNTEDVKLKYYLDRLNSEISKITRRKGIKPTNIVQSIINNETLCIDIGSYSNEIFINTIIHQLEHSIANGFRFNLIIDSIPLKSNEKLNKFLCNPSQNYFITIGSPDFITMVNASEQDFSTIIGNMQVIGIMNHTSGTSAKKWAEVLGKYEMYDESQTYSQGITKRSRYAFGGTYNQGTSKSISKRREYLIAPEVLTRMYADEAYIISYIRGEIAHLRLT